METLSEDFIPEKIVSYLLKNRHIEINKWIILHVQPINLPIQRTQSEIAPF